jgi:uncharacterized membrane protein YgcG
MVRLRTVTPSLKACFAALFLSPTFAFAFDFPALSGRVVDQSGVMTAEAKSDVEAKSKALKDKSGIQLVVATVKSLEGSDIETDANQLFRFWNGEAQQNNGVLLLVAPIDHKVRIEVCYGLEGKIPQDQERSISSRLPPWRLSLSPLPSAASSSYNTLLAGDIQQPTRHGRIWQILLHETPFIFAI